MNDVPFGQTDLRVSRLCQGTGFRNLPRSDCRETRRLIHAALDHGIRFFDSAFVYDWGDAETTLGRALEGRRADAVICTKVPPSQPPRAEGEKPRPARFTREFLFSQAEGSLRRLGADYIDLYLLHSPDEATPMADIAEAMEALVTSGKIRHWGVSNHPHTQVRELLGLRGRQGTTPISGLEEYYNVGGSPRTQLLERHMFPLVRGAGLGLLAYSPLDAGALATGRGADPGTPREAILETLDRVGDESGLSRSQVCVAWVLSHPEVTSVIHGAETVAHLEENIAAAEAVLPAQAAATLDSAIRKAAAGGRTTKGEER